MDKKIKEGIEFSELHRVTKTASGDDIIDELFSRLRQALHDGLTPNLDTYPPDELIKSFLIAAQENGVAFGLILQEPSEDTPLVN